MRRSWTALALVALTMSVCGQTPPATPSARDDTEAVVQWLRAAAVPLTTTEPGRGVDDLRALDDAIGDARIVALGEATHGSREIFQMKHRVLESLVTEMGFTVFAIEASYPDCVAINDYVREGRGDPEVALHGQGFWTWDTEEVLALIRWMRAYNEDPAHARPLSFYGFDMQVSTPALEVALPYLEQLDPAAARNIRQRLAPMTGASFMQQYRTLPDQARQEITRAVAGLVEQLDQHREALIERSSAPEWSTARQHAVIARQFEEMVRTMTAATPSIGFQETVRLLGSISAASTRLLEYLDRVDAEFAERVATTLEDLQGDVEQFVEHYRLELSCDEQAAQRVRAGEIQSRLNEMQRVYTARSSPRQFASAQRDARDLVAFMDLCHEMRDQPQDLPNVRDRSMAENVAWILQQEGPDAKIVLWAHNGHVSHRPAAPGTGSMGNELERRFGDEHLVVGFSFNRGSFQAIHRPADGVWDGGPALRAHTVGAARPDSIDRVFSEAGLPLFVIDLRTAPRAGPVARWLAQPHPMRTIGAVFSSENQASFYQQTILPEHYDLVIFIDDTTRARPNRLTRQKFNLPDPD